VRPIISIILQRLLAPGCRTISLDEIGDAIGAEAISQTEIEALLDALEQAGNQVGGPSPSIKEHLRAVLREARAIRERSQTPPHARDIALATGLSVSDVRAALLYASVLSR
jgi:hypothetical protein